jgi:hypothetical protein
MVSMVALVVAVLGRAWAVLHYLDLVIPEGMAIVHRPTMALVAAAVLAVRVSMAQARQVVMAEQVQPTL